LPKHPLSAVILAAIAFPVAADAAEVTFEGYYRARMRLYDTLSLTNDPELSEGLAATVQHRLWLRPSFLIDDHVALHADLRGLDNVAWGDAPARRIDPVTAQEVPVEWTDEPTAPVIDCLDPSDCTAQENAAVLRDFSLWRAWARVDSPVGRFSFGRMPLHWGAGIWWNDGLGWNAEYGDSADRVQWEGLFDDVFVLAAIDVNAARLAVAGDDTFSTNFGFGYRSERVTAGLLGQWRRSTDRDFDLVTLDAAIDAAIGPIDLDIEALANLGGGDLSGTGNDVRVVAGGAVLDARLTTPKLVVGLRGGLATGDDAPGDNRIRSFTFDRDYNVGIAMFEQPMPIFAADDTAATATGRDLSVAQSGDAIRNALFVQPRAERLLVEDLHAEASLLWARTMVAPADDRGTYGFEIDAGLRWQPYDHLDLTGTLGVFLPGTYYVNYRDDEVSGLNRAVTAGQVIGQVRF
jgi:hypothetical protein